MARPFFTIGHSTRSIEEFVDLLNKAEVGSSPMFGPSRGHAPIRNTTRKLSQKPCPKPVSITSILLRSAACADASATSRRT